MRTASRRRSYSRSRPQRCLRLPPFGAAPHRSRLVDGPLPRAVTVSSGRAGPHVAPPARRAHRSGGVGAASLSLPPPRAVARASLLRYCRRCLQSSPRNPMCLYSYPCPDLSDRDRPEGRGSVLLRRPSSRTARRLDTCTSSPMGSCPQTALGRPCRRGGRDRSKDHSLSRCAPGSPSAHVLAMVHGRLLRFPSAQLERRGCGSSRSQWPGLARPALFSSGPFSASQPPAEKRGRQSTQAPMRPRLSSSGTPGNSARRHGARCLGRRAARTPRRTSPFHEGGGLGSARILDVPVLAAPLPTSSASSSADDE